MAKDTTWAGLRAVAPMPATLGRLPAEAPTKPPPDGDPPGDGVLTPATGIGDALVEGLRAAGLELSIRRL